ncbi:NAD-dependent epimerase/dehydratase family protein [Candidatus Micrarchaeota archaeon]|nr:NAD-dependent epimerase/dehydratase family protein [Candidatus Micrarchaeota archaeon]
MSVLITGSSGTIGTRLMEQMEEALGLDRKPNKWNEKLNKKTINADLLDKEFEKKLDSLNIDAIVHLAANARVYDLVEKPEYALENIVTAFNILEYARKNDVKKIVFASSRESYGNLGTDSPVSEDMVRTDNCESPYAASKISGEAMVRSYGRCYGIDFVIIRFSNVYGMYDDSNRVIPLWIRQLRKNQEITVFGEKKVLDFTYIDDSVKGVRLALEKFSKARGHVFNIAYGKGIKLSYVAESLRRLLNSKSKMKILGNRTGEVWKFEADVKKASEILGFKAEVDFDTGLKKTVEWYNQNMV